MVAPASPVIAVPVGHRSNSPLGPVRGRRTRGTPAQPSRASNHRHPRSLLPSEQCPCWDHLNDTPAALDDMPERLMKSPTAVTSSGVDARRDLVADAVTPAPVTVEAAKKLRGKDASDGYSKAEAIFEISDAIHWGVPLAVDGPDGRRRASVFDSPCGARKVCRRSSGSVWYSLMRPSHRVVRSTVMLAGGVSGGSACGVGGRCLSDWWGRCWLW